MAADTQQASAFAAIETDIDRRLGDAKAPQTMTKDQRTYLVNYAEVSVAGQATDARDAPRAAVGRVQAVYVAGALGTLDKPGTPNPFRDEQLAKEYERAQKFMERSIQRPDREPER